MPSTDAPAPAPGFGKERLKYEYAAMEGLKEKGIYGVRGRPVPYPCPLHDGVDLEI